MDGLGLFIDAWNKNAYMQYGFDYVTSYVPIVYKDNKIGVYKMLFNLNGECFDDFFIIDQLVLIQLNNALVVQQIEDDQ